MVRYGGFVFSYWLDIDVIIEKGKIEKEIWEEKLKFYLG